MKWVQLIDYEVAGRDFYRHCFVIEIKQEILEEIAEKQNMVLYNWMKKSPDYFKKNNKKQFENFRTSHIQQICMYFFEEQLNFQDFIVNGAIESMEFLHEPLKRDRMWKSWLRTNHSLILKNISPRKINPNKLIGLGEVNHYLGCSLAFFLGFSNLIMSFLLLLGIFGGISWLITFTTWTQKNLILMIFSFILSFIMILILKLWERRENELEFLWNTHKISKNQRTQKNHRGEKVIDPLSQNISERPRFTTAQRRLITDPVMAIVGVIIVLINFLIFPYLNEVITSKETTKQITEFQVLVYTNLVGAANAIFNIIFGAIFQQIMTILVTFENHKLLSNELMSFVPKIFIFQFLMSFFNLFYYAFYLKDFQILRNNFISLYVTDSLVSITLSYVLPIISFWWTRRNLMAQLIPIRKERKQNYFIEKGWNSKTQLSKEQQKEIIDFEKNLQLWEQIELDSLKSSPPEMSSIWINELIHFGYLAFFGIIFPIAPLIGVFINYIDAYLALYMFANVSQRARIILMKDSGIYNDLLKIIIYSSLAVNGGLFAFYSRVDLGFLNLKKFSNEFAYLLIFEHILFAINILVSRVLSGLPNWVAKELSDRAIKDRINKELSTEQIKIDETPQSGIFDIKTIQKLASYITDDGLKQTKRTEDLSFSKTIDFD